MTTSDASPRDTLGAGVLATPVVAAADMTTSEAPVWDVDEERLYWIDVFRATVHRCTLDGRELRSSKFPGRLIASLALRHGGGTVVTSGGRIYLFDLDSCDAELIFDAALGPMFGFNDGTVDPQGRFVTGMADGNLINSATSGVPADVEPSADLYRVDADLSVHTIDGEIGVTNGPCFSADGTTFYCNDSWARCVYAWDYEPATGNANNRRVFARFEDGDPIPDRATLDEEGCLWIAAFRGGEVRRYAPDGTLDRRVPVAVASPTSVAFAGADLDVLVVTSRRDNSSHTEAVPVLALRGLGVRGLPEPKFQSP